VFTNRRKNIGEAKVGLTKHHSGHAPPFFEKLQTGAFQKRGSRSKEQQWQRINEEGMSAKFLGLATNSGRGVLPRRSGWKPLRHFRWIPTEHFKAGIET